jgi:hypothetical protein
MKIHQISYKPVTDIVFTLPEIELLVKCANGHYDSKCKETTLTGGLLYVLRRRIGFHLSGANKLEQFTHDLTFGEIDLLSKIIEVGQYIPDKSECTLSLIMSAEFGKIAGMINEVAVKPFKPTAF